MVKDGEKKINDFLTGFLEEMEYVPSAGPGSQRVKEEAEAAEGKKRIPRLDDSTEAIKTIINELRISEQNPII